MGLSGGAIAGIVIGAVVVVALIALIVMWTQSQDSSHKKKRSQGVDGLPTQQPSMQSMPSGKGDHFLTNLVPSFVKRNPA